MVSNGVRLSKYTFLEFVDCGMVIIMTSIHTIKPVKLDLIECGVDHALDVVEGDVRLNEYPFVGVLYYKYFGSESDERLVTTVVLIQKEFVIGAAADIGPMSDKMFRQRSRVLLGEQWNAVPRRVRNYVLHPEYGETYNTVALVQLVNPVRDPKIRPVCPPPNFINNPYFYVIKMKDDYENSVVLQKEVVRVTHVPGKMCKDFYVAAKLYSKMMRPPHVACAVALNTKEVCVWNAGSPLLVRDVWGRWQLVGLSVRGPGCGAPSRYLDMMSYYPWVEYALSQFQMLTISKIHKQKYVLRSGDAYQRYGNCDTEEELELAYRETISLRTDNNQYQFLTYNMTVYGNIEYTCLTLELVNASAVSEMRVTHTCPRDSKGPPCYRYRGSRFDISVYLMFSTTCIFEMFAWGFSKSMKLIDIQEWKWEEGTYYEDFTMQRVEYRGPMYQTDFGFEPLDKTLWVPNYDLWSTTSYPPPPAPTSPTRRRRTTTTTTTRRSRTTRSRTTPHTTTTTTTTEAV